MGSFVKVSLIAAIITGFCALVYASYSDGYAHGFGTGYSQGYDTGCTQQVETEYNEPPDIEPEFSDIADMVGNQNIASDYHIVELKNPTSEEVKDFITRDPTNRNKWVRNAYECRHFATDVCNDARDAGLNCAFVLLCYEKGQHAVVAFDTVDRGLVYIEPQTNMVIYPEIGGQSEGKEIKEILIAW